MTEGMAQRSLLQHPSSAQAVVGPFLTFDVDFR
jgi:hypothetical protein